MSLKFKSALVNGQRFYYVYNEQGTGTMVTKDAYDRMKAEQEENEKQEIDCPFCSTVKLVLSDLNDIKSQDEKFSYLHSVLSDCQKVNWQEGYKQALKDQIEAMGGLISHIEDDECDGDCESCQRECED